MRPELPDPATMSVEDLRAEVEGGRIAYEHMIEIKEGLEAKVKWMRGNLDGERAAVRLLQKQLRAAPPNGVEPTKETP